MYRASTKAGKVSNREMRKRAEAAISDGARAVLVLVAVLAQKGGEVVITSGTLEQCTRNLQNLDFGIFPNGNAPGEFVIRLLEGVGNEPVGEHTGDDRLPGAHGGVAEDGSGDNGSAAEAVAEAVVPVA